MKPLELPLSRLKEVVLFFLFIFSAGNLYAQVSITSLTTYSQNFDGLTKTGTPVAPGQVTWVNNTTLPSWYAYTDSMAISTIYASFGSFTYPGLVSYGNNNSSERSLGYVTSNKTRDAASGLRMKNNTGDVIRNFTVTYTMEIWAVPSGNKKSADITLSYKTGAAVTNLGDSTGWTKVPELAVTVTTNGGGGGGYTDGNKPQYRKAVTFTINDIDLAPGNEIMFRFDNDYYKNFGFYLAIDDLTITPSGASETYYSRSNGALNRLASWGANPDGSGTNPVKFARSYQTFRLVNNLAPTITSDWTVSGTKTKIEVGDGTQPVNLTIPDNYALSGTIDVLNYATVTVSNPVSPTFGNLANNSTVIYNSLSPQVLPSLEYAQLVLTGGDKSLSTNAVVRENLTLNGTKLLLGNYNLALSNNATITGADNSAYIVTVGTGSLKRTVANNNTEVLFPVGTNSYVPVIIKQAPTAVTDNFSVRILNGIYFNYINNVPDATPKYKFSRESVDRTWIIDEDVVGGSEVTLKFGWGITDAFEDFNLSEARINHFKNEAWDDFIPGEAVAGNGKYWISRNNITSFSPFGVFSAPPATLPVELISFEADRSGNAIVCNWKTATENDNNYFGVERSLNGKEFTQIGKVKGSGSNAQICAYQFHDENAPAELAYYRIRQVDFSGDVAYSKVIKVLGIQNPPAFAVEVFPNPGRGNHFLKASLETEGPVEIMVSDIQGKVVLCKQVQGRELAAGLNLSFPFQQKGIYLLTIRSNKESAVLRLVQQ
jgi:hypothetical protein